MKYNICKLCKLAGVSRSGYYKWLNGTERFTDRAKENKIIKQLILEIHNKYRGTMDVKECVQLLIFSKENWRYTINFTKGNCWDNTPIESFFSHLKSELIYLVNTTDVHELTKLVHEYIYFYNNDRIQNKIGMSPIEYLTHVA